LSNDIPAWRDYILDHDLGTVFHLPAWSQGVSQSYGHRPMHLLAEEDGKIRGVLPLFLIKSVFVGRVLVSVPYATYGGIVADDHKTTLALLEAARDLARTHRAQYLELRHRENRNIDIPVIDRYDTFRKQLPEKSDEILSALPRKTRAAARKGCKLLDVKIERGDGLTDTIYDLYAWTLRRLGSPNYKRRFFHDLARAYGDDCVGLVVYDEGKAVAGVISFTFRDEIVPYFSGSYESAMRKNCNNAMYIRLMEWATDQNLRWFDFNRTRRDNHGPHAFKRYHGFEPEPLQYQIDLNLAKELPNLSPSNRKFKMAGNVWRKLPLAITRCAGGVISKWIP